MVRLNNAVRGGILLFSASIGGAQSSADMAKILERLDRLERENQALAAEVNHLRARLDGTAEPSDSQPAGSPDTAEIRPAPATIEQRVAIQEERTSELAQTKVEASQKYPIRL